MNRVPGSEESDQDQKSTESSGTALTEVSGGAGELPGENQEHNWDDLPGDSELPGDHQEHNV